MIGRIIEKIYFSYAIKVQTSLFNSGLRDLDMFIEYKKRMLPIIGNKDHFWDTDTLKRERKMCHLDFEALKLKEEEGMTPKTEYRIKKAEEEYYQFYKKKMDRIERIKRETAYYNGKDKDIDHATAYIYKKNNNIEMSEFEKKQGYAAIERIKSNNISK